MLAGVQYPGAACQAWLELVWAAGEMRVALTAASTLQLSGAQRVRQL